MSETPQSVSDYLASIGGKGGLARTEAKKAAGKRNAAKAREAKALKRLRPMATETRHKPAGAAWEGAVSLRDVQKTAKAQRGNRREGDPSERGLRIQTTGRKR